MIPFCGVGRPMALLLHFLLAGLAARRLSLLGRICRFCRNAQGLCVCEWDCRERVEGTSFPLPTLSRTTIVLEAGLTSAFWERCDHQDGFSIVGFLKSKDYMDSYLATARHFCRPGAPGPSNARVPQKMLESQEETFHQA